MVILIERFGNHCNRLFQTSHIEAFCLENRIAFVNLTLNDMSRIYPISAFPFGRFLARLAIKLERLGFIKALNMTDFQKQADYELAMKRGGLVFVKGWCFRRHDLTAKHAVRLRGKFGLKVKFKTGELVARIENAKAEGLVLVGIHIRRGDYKTWNDGKYFFTDAVYEQHMSMSRSVLLEALGVENEKIRFVVFSNEVIEIQERSTVWISNQEWYVDQYLMSLCHYLIGPPSTFSLWASFIGGAGVYHIKDPSESMSISDFVVCP